MIENRRTLILEMQKEAVRLQNQNRVPDIAFLLRAAVELIVTDLLNMNYYEAKAKTMHEIILEMHECGLISDNEKDALSTANYWGNSGYHNNGASFTADESMLALEQCLSIYDCHFEKHTKAEQHKAKEVLETLIEIRKAFDNAVDDYNGGRYSLCISTLRGSFNRIVESVCDICRIKKTKEDGSYLKTFELLEELSKRKIISDYCFSSRYSHSNYKNFIELANVKGGHNYSSGAGDVTRKDAENAISYFDYIFEDTKNVLAKKWPDVCWEESIGQSKYRIEQKQIEQKRIESERIKRAVDRIEQEELERIEQEQERTSPEQIDSERIKQELTEQYLPKKKREQNWQRKKEVREDIILKEREDALYSIKKNKLKNAALSLRSAVEYVVNSLCKWDLFDEKFNTDVNRKINALYEAGCIDSNSRERLSRANYFGNSGYHDNGASFTADEIVDLFSFLLSLYKVQYKNYADRRERYAKEFLQKYNELKEEFNSAYDDFINRKYALCVAGLTSSFLSIIDFLCERYRISGYETNACDKINQLKGVGVIRDSEPWHNFRMLANIKADHKYSAGEGEVTRKNAKTALHLFEKIFEQTADICDRAFSEVDWRKVLDGSNFRKNQFAYPLTNLIKKLFKSFLSHDNWGCLPVALIVVAVLTGVIMAFDKLGLGFGSSFLIALGLVALGSILMSRFS